MEVGRTSVHLPGLRGGQAGVKRKGVRMFEERYKRDESHQDQAGATARANDCALVQAFGSALRNVP
jgi:hypothetical protein